MSPTYERSPKASHRETVEYEIQMLNFCFDTVMHSTAGDEKALVDLRIEGFLLHFRNLIRCFSGQHHRDGDLSIANPGEWSKTKVSDDRVGAIKRLAKPLDDTYYRDISKYLQHCTLVRHTESKDWDMTTMKKELDHVVAEFEAAFPRQIPTDGTR